MSRSPDRIQRVIDSLETNARPLEGYEESKPETKDDLLLTVIIPARNEFPNIVHTVHSILNCWEADGFTHDQIEIIIVNNCSTEYNYSTTVKQGDWFEFSEEVEQEKYDWSKPGDRGTTEHLMPRGIYHSRVLRVMYDPIAGNHSARNKGARMARGRYLFFSDAHMSYAPGTFKYGIKATEESKGIVHCGIAWMGGYPQHPTSVGTQYTIKLGEEWKGTWATYRPWDNSKGWFYIAAQGHCSLFVERKQFLDFGGYPEVHRTYGGGEFFTDMLWWMYGSSVVCEPRAVGYHLASSRGYSYNHDDYVHNLFNCAWALGCDDWLERSYLNYCRKGRKVVLDRMMDEARIEMKDRREEIERRRICTFNDLLVKRPWDTLNMERGGAKNSSMLIFHQTWLKLLDGYPLIREMYDKSETQKKLAEFIMTNLKDHVYKFKEYENVT